MMYSMRAILLHIDRCKKCRYDLIYCSKCKNCRLLSLGDIYELSKVDGIGFCQSCVQ